MHTSDYRIYFHRLSWLIVLSVVFLLTAGTPVNRRQEEPTDGFVPGENCPIQTHYAPGEIPRLNEAAEHTARATLDALAKIPPEERTFDNTFIAFDRIMTDYADAVLPLCLMGNVYPDAGIAAEGMSCEESSSVFSTGVYTRRDLYDVLREQTPRTPEESRLYDVTIREFEKNGLKLSEESLTKVRELKTALSGRETRYSANLNNDTTTLEFTADDLKGIPASSMATFEKTPQGTCLVTMKYPDYLAVMTYAKMSGTRMRMYEAYNNRQADTNTALLEEAIVLRQNIASELGYATWADYKIDGRMAGDTATVMEFLTAMQEPLKEKYRDEMANLLSIKQRLEPVATAVSPWDVAYLHEIQKKEQYAYDEEEVREYFPVDTVLQGLFDTYGTLFGIRFSEIKDAPVWSPDVRLYEVNNLAENDRIGYLYLDLYPREGKYGHFCAAEVINGRQKDGTYTVPVMAIIGNFRKPEEGRPSLLTINEIETLFHEAGHAMHYLLTTAPYGTLSGFSVEWDFVETPSQTLEEWVWDPEVLESISGHYTNPSEKIPSDLRDRIIAAQDVGMGSLYSRLLLNSLEDMRFHIATVPVDVTEVWYQIYEDIMGTRPLPGTHQPASFGHLMGGYDAGYYGYLWSKVYAFNIVNAFKETGMTNPTLGKKFRDEILSKGNMEEGMVLLERFLGREPGAEALYEHLGIPMPSDETLPKEQKNR
ncbi:Zn-dependent oligopeptidase [Methanogenium marinum]|uniref:Zn-dependent oligopeptidase n=1 Tax=Methanogenium marinum TaxID=348610 RepID=A0A9Q4KSV2_9EURY|nr:M3 family metallopeptidase [Methanogenium marinum]MDE4908147.1 Zn-dependent oligopeptidase [Methanogenium marinum]